MGTSLITGIKLCVCVWECERYFQLSGCSLGDKWLSIMGGGGVNNVVGVDFIISITNPSTITSKSESVSQHDCVWGRGVPVNNIVLSYAYKMFKTKIQISLHAHTHGQTYHTHTHTFYGPNLAKILQFSRSISWRQHHFLIFCFHFLKLRTLLVNKMVLAVRFFYQK